MGYTLCCCSQDTLSTSQALETPGFSQERGQAPVQSRKEGYLVRTSSPQSLSRKEFGQAGGVLLTSGVQ